MSSSLIPCDNSSYNCVNYWNQRYESDEKSYDWLVNYSNISHIIEKCVSKSHSILMLGCGNSLLSEQMFSDGYHNIHNIDYSEAVIKQMSTHCDKCNQMKWQVMDCLDLKYDDHSFDVVIEKATIDALLTEEKSPWNISQESVMRVSSVLKEVLRVLKPEGQFFSISFFGPHFRRGLYSIPNLSMKAIYELENNFHYYCYRLNKSIETIELKPIEYESPKMISCLNSGCNQTIDTSDDNKVEPNYIFNINL